MVFQNSCVVPFGTTAMVNVLPALPLAPAAGCFEPASAPPLHAAASAISTAAVPERRVVVNESLQSGEVERRGSASNGRECTGRPEEAAELEDDHTFHVIRAPVITPECRGHGIERAIAVSEERGHVDRSPLDEIECLRM